MASPLIIQPSTIDTYLSQVAPNSNYGTGAFLLVQSYTSANRRSIIKFDASALPAGVTITAAELDLYYYNTSADPKTRTYWANRITQTAWVEAEATWNAYNAVPTLWATAGGDFTATDRASATMPAAYGWVSWNVLALAQYFQANTGNVAHFLIKDGTEDSAGGENASFYSREGTPGDTSLRPKYIITYTTPSGQPAMMRFGGVPFCSPNRGVWYRPQKLVSPTMKEILKYNKGGW